MNVREPSAPMWVRRYVRAVGAESGHAQEPQPVVARVQLEARVNVGISREDRVADRRRRERAIQDDPRDDPDRTCEHRKSGDVEKARFGAMDLRNQQETESRQPCHDEEGEPREESCSPHVGTDCDFGQLIAGEEREDGSRGASDRSQIARQAAATSSVRRLALRESECPSGSDDLECGRRDGQGRRILHRPPPWEHHFPTTTGPPSSQPVRSRELTRLDPILACDAPCAMEDPSGPPARESSMFSTLGSLNCSL